MRKLTITIHQDKIADFCRRNNIRELALFGFVLRADFGPESDIDVLVEFEQGKEPDLMDIVRIQNELSEILGHNVDMVERESVEKSKNYIRKRHILQSLEAVYVA